MSRDIELKASQPRTMNKSKSLTELREFPCSVVHQHRLRIRSHFHISKYKYKIKDIGRKINQTEN